MPRRPRNRTGRRAPWVPSPTSSWSPPASATAVVRQPLRHARTPARQHCASRHSPGTASRDVTLHPEAGAMSRGRRLSSPSCLLGALFGLLIMGGAVVSRAQEGAVLAVRSEGIVIDLGEIEGAQRETKLGFVRGEDQRREIGQGVVIEVRERKALVRPAPKTVVSEGDAVVLCPTPGRDDRFAELRGSLEQSQQGGPLIAQLKSALAKRDVAVQKGACYTGEYDRQ